MKCHCCENEYIKVSKKTYQCKNCNHIYQNWNKSKEWVSNYYKTYRKTNPISKNKYRNIYTENSSNFFVESCDLSNKKILEIGAYDGKLISKIGKHFKNCELHVNDIDPGTQKILEENFSNIHICDFLDIDGKFDALIAVDVWEHFDDVSVFYKKVLEMSCEYLLLQVPVNRGFKSDNVEFRPHYHNSNLKSFNLFWSKDFDLISYKVSDPGFSATKQELLCVFKKR